MRGRCSGRIIRETKVASEPEALVGFFAGLGVAVTRIGLEAGPLSQWLHAGLTGAGFEAVLLETRHVKAALSAMIVKTDWCGWPLLAPSCQGGGCHPVARRPSPCRSARSVSTLPSVSARSTAWTGTATSSCAGSCAGPKSSVSSAKLPPCLVGMEACGTSHYWARELTALGHQVRLMPPQYVKIP